MMFVAMHKIAAVVVCALFFIQFSTAEEGEPCATPINLPGVCINFKQCQPLLNILSKQGLTQALTTYLRKSGCGYTGRDPLVCCPIVEAGGRGRQDSTSRPIVAFPDARPTSPPSPPTQATTESRFTGYTLPRAPDCGYSNISNTRVVGGVDASLGEFPWMVALGYRNSKNPNNPKWLCGGSMITSKHVLTAAHCIIDDLYLARLGDLDLFSDEDGATPSDIEIVKAVRHEDYSQASSSSDIAILTLAKDHKNPTVKPVCLPLNEPLRSNKFVKYYPFVAGWGSTQFRGPSSPILQVAMVPVVSTEQCRVPFLRTSAAIDDRVICAGYTSGGRDACQGDSGGPLMYAEKRRGVSGNDFYQIGVVSFGYKCAEPGYYGVYTRVTAFLDWIQENLN